MRRWMALVVALAIVVGGIVAAALGYGPAGLRSLAWPWRGRPTGIDPGAPIDPARQYHLVVWDYRLPFVSPGGADFPECSRRAIDRFVRLHPNVTVDLVVLDPATGPRRLAEALAAGYPPDVYCSPFGPPLVGSALQVPVGLYLDEDTWRTFSPVAWQTVKTGGVVWSWPRWVLLWPWLGNRTLLAGTGLDLTKVGETGWTRDDFARVAAALASSGGTYERTATLAAPSPATVVRDLLLPGHLAAAEPPAPDSYWLGREPATVARWLSELNEAGALRQDETEPDPGAIDSFVHRRAAILAPSSPWVVLYLLELVKRPRPTEYSLPERVEQPSMVLLPPPHGPDQSSVVWVSPGTVMVFRQARYRGDDNTRLSAELARELCTGLRPWLRDQVLCAPADQSELAAWRLRCSRYGEVGTFAVQTLDRLAALPKDRLSLALAALTYGSWGPTTPGSPDAAGADGSVRSSGVAGRPTPSNRWQDKPSLGSSGYLGPFLERVVAPVAARFWKGDAPPEELARSLAEGVLSEP